MLCLAQSGDNIVASANLYGGTITQFNVTLKRLGITCTSCPVAIPMRCSLRSVRRREPFSLKRSATPRALSPTSGARRCGSSRGRAAHRRQHVRFAELCRPIEWGADIVVHSATKYLCGHGTVIGGVLVEAGRFPWGDQFPLLSEPSPGYHGLNFAETFGEYAYLMRARAEVLRNVGACLSPMNAWLLIQGIETLPLRMAGHVENARQSRVSCANVTKSRGSSLPSSTTVPSERSRASIFPTGRAASSPSACGADARPGARSSKGSSCGATLPMSATQRAWSSIRPRRRTNS